MLDSEVVAYRQTYGVFQHGYSSEEVDDALRNLAATQHIRPDIIWNIEQLERKASLVGRSLRSIALALEPDQPEPMRDQEFGEMPKPVAELEVNWSPSHLARIVVADSLDLVAVRLCNLEDPQGNNETPRKKGLLITFPTSGFSRLDSLRLFAQNGVKNGSPAYYPLFFHPEPEHIKGYARVLKKTVRELFRKPGR